MPDRIRREGRDRTVRIYSEVHPEYAERLADQTGMELAAVRPPESELYLEAGTDGVALVYGAQKLRGDFMKLRARIRPHNLNGEQIVKAARIQGHIQGLTVVDATAGLGEDSFLLAAAGCDVTLYEYNPVIALLLEDAIRRAAAQAEWSEIVSRMHFRIGDSRKALQEISPSPDVVFLDPMFPARQKSSLVRKKLQMIQRLEIPCDDEAAMLDAAMAAHPRKIIVKRPRKAAELVDRKPSYIIPGKSIRYDCYVL